MASERLYAERLLPTWWVWILAAVLVAALAVAYGAALGSSAGVLVFVATAAVVIALLWVTAPTVSITETALCVDKARLPRSAIAEVDVVDTERIRALRGPGSDARLFVALRPWSAKGGLLVTLADDEDPHPAWLFSSRHPARAAEALAATM